MNKVKKNYDFIHKETEIGRSEGRREKGGGDRKGRGRGKVNGAKCSELENLGNRHTGVLCTTLPILLKFKIITNLKFFKG